MTYIQSEGESIRLECLKRESEEFFKMHSLCAPSKDIIDRLMPSLFGSTTFFEYENGTRYASYKNVSKRTHVTVSVTENHPQDIILPNHCIQKLYIDENKWNLVFPCQRC